MIFFRGEDSLVPTGLTFWTVQNHKVNDKTMCGSELSNSHTWGDQAVLTPIFLKLWMHQCKTRTIKKKETQAYYIQ